MYMNAWNTTRVLLVLGLISFGLSQPSTGWATTTMVQPGKSNTVVEQKLNACVAIAKQGDVLAAFEMAQQVRATLGTERMFAVNYINTLLTIVETQPTTHDQAILNEAISVVNAERESNKYEGNLDVEVAYYFMQSLGKLSEATMKVNERVSAKIRIYEGKIADNLASNPGYPRNALESLAKPLFSMAQGYAIRHNQRQAFVALGKAVDVGYGDFDSILNDPIIGRLENQGAIEELVDNLKVRYQRAAQKWARTVLAEFQPSQFKFDVADIEGGRLRNADFGGKLIVLDMWATWCPPCRKGIPHFIELQEKYRSQGVAVIGVAMDNTNDPYSAMGTVQQFVAEQHFNYPCGLGDQSFSQMVPGQQVLPTTVFIDGHNQVRYIAKGYHDYVKLAAITEALTSESQMVQAGLPSNSN